MVSAEDDPGGSVSERVLYWSWTKARYGPTVTAPTSGARCASAYTGSRLLEAGDPKTGSLSFHSSRSKPGRQWTDLHPTPPPSTY